MSVPSIHAKEYQSVKFFFLMPLIKIANSRIPSMMYMNDGSKISSFPKTPMKEDRNFVTKVRNAANVQIGFCPCHKINVCFNPRISPTEMRLWINHQPEIATAPAKEIHKWRKGFFQKNPTVVISKIGYREYFVNNPTPSKIPNTSDFEIDIVCLS